MFNCFSDPKKKEGSDPDPAPQKEEYKQMSIGEGWISADEEGGKDILPDPDDWGNITANKI